MSTHWADSGRRRRSHPRSDAITCKIVPIEEIRSLIVATASKYGVPSTIALAVAQQESGYDQGAIGSSGEVGVFQLMPGTAAELGVDPYNLQQNINGGLAYLSQQYQTFGSWDLALAAYNAGPGSVTAGRIPATTRSYVSSVLGANGVLQLPEAPIFRTTVWGEPIEAFPWWIVALGIGTLLALLRGKRRPATV